MLRAIVAVSLLAALHCSAEESDFQFTARSPDGRFDVVFDHMAMPQLIIREVGTNKPMMSMDENRFCGRGAQASWAPDSTKLVILVHCRLADFMHVCRLDTESIPYFRRTEGPKLPEDTVRLGAWTSNTTLKVESEKKVYTIKITEDSAAFTK
jgi:hypothetical protein